MQPFKLTLSNNATVTGLHNIPPPSPPIRPKHCPLIVCLHGAGYSAQYFDVHPSCTASIISNGLNIPVVAIDRPGYQDSTSFYPIPDSSSYHQEFGRWLHAYILPALWSAYGEPNSCSSVVLHCHSLGAPGAIVAAGLHAAQLDHSYPLAGLSMSGIGCQFKGQPSRPPPPSEGPDGPPPPPPPTSVKMPTDLKDRLMLGPVDQGRVDPELYKLTESLNQARTVEEVGALATHWYPLWREWAAGVKVPVMVAMAGDDGLWRGTQQHLEEFVGGFTGSERVDASLILGGPHNLEMSYWALGWYARCFGFAVECAATAGQRGVV